MRTACVIHRVTQSQNRTAEALRRKVLIFKSSAPRRLGKMIYFLTVWPIKRITAQTMNADTAANSQGT
jgi:hypothetical protein